MSLQKYVQQLKPIQENYIKPDEKIQVLSEAKATASTLFEGVIADCANLSGKSQSVFKKEILKQQYVPQFLSLADKMSGKAGKTAFITKGKSDKEKLDILWKFSQVCKVKLKGAKVDAGAGQSKQKVSAPWIRMSQKRGGIDTSKADINVGVAQTSVKGPSAQLMSGEQKEVRATVLSALQTVTDSDKKIVDGLIKVVDEFVTNTRTIGADVKSGLLKKMTAQQAKETGNEEAKAIVDAQEEGKAKINQVFINAFKNKSVGDAFCREAMTGYEKFGGKAFPEEESGNPKAEATHMLIWDYGMDKMRFEKIGDKLISETSKKMKPVADLKSGSYKAGGKKVGYNFYQALRVGIKTYLDDTDKIVDDAKEEMEYNRQMLSEGMINENKFKDILKNIFQKVKGKIIGFFNKLIEKVKEIANRAKEIIKTSIDRALEFFDLDVNVKVQTIVTYKV